MVGGDGTDRADEALSRRLRDAVLGQIEVEMNVSITRAFASVTEDALRRAFEIAEAGHRRDCTAPLIGPSLDSRPGPDASSSNPSQALRTASCWADEISCLVGDRSMMECHQAGRYRLGLCEKHEKEILG